jgi:hypothetical protein
MEIHIIAAVEEPEGLTLAGPKTAVGHDHETIPRISCYHKRLNNFELPEATL